VHPISPGTQPHWCRSIPRDCLLHDSCAINRRVEIQRERGVKAVGTLSPKLYPTHLLRYLHSHDLFRLTIDIERDLTIYACKDICRQVNLPRPIFNHHRLARPHGARTMRKAGLNAATLPRCQSQRDTRHRASHPIDEIHHQPSSRDIPHSTKQELRTTPSHDIYRHVTEHSLLAGSIEALPRNHGI
jgi:hypothetical protein